MHDTADDTLSLSQYDDNDQITRDIYTQVKNNDAIKMVKHQRVERSNGSKKIYLINEWKADELGRRTRTSRKPKGVYWKPATGDISHQPLAPGQDVIINESKGAALDLDDYLGWRKKKLHQRSHCFAPHDHSSIEWDDRDIMNSTEINGGPNGNRDAKAHICDCGCGRAITPMRRPKPTSATCQGSRLHTKLQTNQKTFLIRNSRNAGGDMHVTVNYPATFKDKYSCTRFGSSRGVSHSPATQNEPDNSRNSSKSCKILDTSDATISISLPENYEFVAG